MNMITVADSRCDKAPKELQEIAKKYNAILIDDGFTLLFKKTDKGTLDLYKALIEMKRNPVFHAVLYDIETPDEKQSNVNLDYYDEYLFRIRFLNVDPKDRAANIYSVPVYFCTELATKRDIKESKERYPQYKIEVINLVTNQKVIIQ